MKGRSSDITAYLSTISTVSMEINTRKQIRTVGSLIHPILSEERKVRLRREDVVFHRKEIRFETANVAEVIRD